MEKWPNAKSVIKLKASITIQVRVTCGGLLVGLMQPIHPTGGPQTVHLLNPMSKLVPHLGRASKAHPSTKVSDCVQQYVHGCVCKEKTECDERAQNQSREGPRVD